ncbi:MAG: nucleotidyltransferase family protein [Actinobacteria bacterium]|nr:nucleotidyltransferase family protein [Actinomycetota bacterium]
MLDRGFVGAVQRRDLTGYRITAADARRLAQERVVCEVEALLPAFPDAAEPAAAEFLRRQGKADRLRSLTQAATATRVAEILSEAGVATLVYKGVALATSSTGDWRGRRSADVDILIDRAATTRAHEALLGAGLHRLDDAPTANKSETPDPPSRFKKLRAIETSYAGLPVGIDLHWDVEFPGYFGIPFAESWSRRRRIDDGGLRVWTLSRPEALLVAALHGTREEWRNFRQVLDFAELAARLSESEWREVEKLSQRGAAKSLAVGLAVAGAYGCTGLPAVPTRKGERLGARYLRHDPAQGAKSLGHRPIDALDRRLGRWRTAPNAKVALNALALAAVRQAVESKRSWSLRAGQA